MKHTTTYPFGVFLKNSRPKYPQSFSSSSPLHLSPSPRRHLCSPSPGGTPPSCPHHTARGTQRSRSQHTARGATGSGGARASDAEDQAACAGLGRRSCVRVGRDAAQLTAALQPHGAGPQARERRAGRLACFGAVRGGATVGIHPWRHSAWLPWHRRRRRHSKSSELGADGWEGAGGGGGRTEESMSAPAPWERGRRGNGRKKIGAFWPINLIKHVEGVRSGMFSTNVKL